MANALFILVLLLSPLPVCWILYGYLKAHTTKLEGTLFRNLHFRASGPVALYLLLMMTTVLLVDPSRFSTRIDLAHTDWSYELDLSPGSSSGIPSRSSLRGVLHLESRPGYALSVTGSTSVDHDHHFLDAKFGMSDGTMVYLPFLFSTLKLRLAAFGPLGTDHNHVRLDIYQLAHEWPKTLDQASEPLTPVGSITLSRRMPFGYLFSLMFLPLIVLLGLHLVGLPLKAHLRGKANKDTQSFPMGPLSNWVHVTNLQLSGTTAAYALVFLAIWWILEEPTRNWVQEEGQAYGMCLAVKGTWYFRLYSLLAEEYSHLDHVGRVVITCNAAQKGYVQLVGIGNPVSKPSSTPTACYEQEDPDGFQWQSILGTVIDQHLIGIYKTNRGGDTGLLEGRISKEEPILTWDFYDFKDEEHHTQARNRGRLKLFRPQSAHQFPCQTQ